MLWQLQSRRGEMRFAAPSGCLHPGLSDRSLPHALWEEGLVSCWQTRRQPSRLSRCWFVASMLLSDLFCDPLQADACCQPHWNHEGETREAWKDAVGLTSSVLNAHPKPPCPCCEPPQDHYLAKHLAAAHYNTGASELLNTQSKEKHPPSFHPHNWKGLLLPCCPLLIAPVCCSPPFPQAALH